MATKRIAYTYDELAERGWITELISAYLPPMRSSHRRNAPCCTTARSVRV